MTGVASGPGQSGLRPEPASRLGHSATVPNAAELMALSKLDWQRKKVAKLREALEFYEDSDEGPADLSERYYKESARLDHMTGKALEYAFVMGRPAVLFASGMEARRAASEAAVHDSPTGAAGDAQKGPS